MRALRRLFPAFLIAAAIAPFAAGIGNSFLGDDLFLVFRRFAAASPLEFFREDYWYPLLPSGLYRPIGLLFLYAEHLAFGQTPAPYHSVTILLHAAASLLVWRLLRPVAGSFASAAGALLFAVHPIHAEAVLTVYGQFDVLAAVLLLLALLLIREGWIAAGFVMLLAAALTKESVFVAPLLFVLLHLARRGRSRLFGRKIVAVTLPILLAVAARYLAIGGFSVPGEWSVTGGLGGPGLRLKAVIISMAHAIRLCVIPTGQTVYYGHLRDSLFGRPYDEAAWLVLFVCCAAALLRWAPRRRAAFCLAWFLAALLPVSNILPIGILVAERTLYLPSIGIAALGGLVLARLRAIPRRGRWAAASPALCGALLVICLVASVRVSRAWSSEESLWRSTVADHPTSPRAHALLGLAILDTPPFDRDRIAEARAEFDRALELNSGSAEAIFGIGRILMAQQDYRAALPYLERAVALRPSAQEMADALSFCRGRLDGR